MTDFRNRVMPSVRWAPEQDGMGVCDSLSHFACRMSMEQAVIWDLLFRFPMTTAVPLLAEVLRVPPSEAERQIEDCLRDWSEKGLIRP